MDNALRALADPHRRVVIERLSHGPASAGDLGALLPISQPATSRHLSVLKEAGLVDVEQDAQRRIYRLRPEPLAEVQHWIDARQREWEQRFAALHTEIARGKKDRRDK